ncbi:hypothetical protein EUGRSUZ_A01953 [Eucalyptus grandis]|uniref:Elongin-A n=3 Tax=Eucalyptus grandis TaxID=71139 RepID=A0A059DGZ7_EUCGR|nr:hypothetical protein EUGRSUZ_A01953 [Eucalyptus grandis]KAK3446214.1 hypothetical protein EUGRSUZ_A01953 [Eucalyptus grandis]
MRSEVGSRRIGCEFGRNMLMKSEPPSLVDLCVRTVIDNLRYLGDVGGTDPQLLARILPHCTVDQLMHIEKSTKGRDLTPITDDLWKNFYEKEFGIRNTKLVNERMEDKGVSFRWSQLYEAKLKDIEQAQKKSLDRMKQRYKETDARKQSRQVRLCTKVPPSSNKRSFGGSYNVSYLKSNIMKKAKIEALKSPEVKNIAAMKKNAIQRDYSISPLMRPRGPSSGDSASSSKVTKPMGRRI